MFAEHKEFTSVQQYTFTVTNQRSFISKVVENTFINNVYQAQKNTATLTKLDITLDDGNEKFSLSEFRIHGTHQNDFISHCIDVKFFRIHVLIASSRKSQNFYIRLCLHRINFQEKCVFFHIYSNLLNT